MAFVSAGDLLAGFHLCCVAPLCLLQISGLRNMAVEFVVDLKCANPSLHMA
jgi:hypothetical protein